MIADMNAKHGCGVRGMTDALRLRLENHRWPGNVRELRNTIERAVILAGNGLLGVEHLAPGFGDAMPAMRREQLLWRRRLSCCWTIF
jgi:DNA-binding NtrC family response regulator